MHVDAAPRRWFGRHFRGQPSTRMYTMMLTSDHTTDTPTEKKTSRRMGAEEERRLAVAWRTDGDRAARERLVTENLGLVVAIAQRYRQCGVPLDELIAEGNLGLLHAVDGFDPD